MAGRGAGRAYPVPVAISSNACFPPRRPEPSRAKTTQPFFRREVGAGGTPPGWNSDLFGFRESANQISCLRVPRTSVRTKRTPGGVRPRRLDWHIDSPPVYAKAPTATTNHQQGRNGTKTVFPRTPPKEIAWFRYRLEPFSLRVSVQLDRTDLF